MSRFYKRSLLCFVLTLSVMLVSGMRVLTVATEDGLKEVADSQSTRRVDVALTRGGIFDCNGVRLTDTSYKSATVVLPTHSASVMLAEYLSGEELTNAAEKLRKGQAVTLWETVALQQKGCVNFFVPTRYSGQLTHVLGYLGADGHGLTGVEKAFDSLLYTEQYMGVSYSTDSLGRALEGVDYTVHEGKSDSKVTLTIDSVLQAIAEQAMVDVTAGAAVIMEARTGKLKAVVSCPDYDPTDIAAALTAENSPLINRATYSYNVGSVFKPCLAAAALENGLGDYRYTCTGSITVGDLTFKCNRSSGHGELGLKEALAQSCNTYFYTLGEALGAETVYNMAKTLRFGEELDCGGGVVSASGGVPSLSTLKSRPAELTNLSIGQGELMLSPIAIASMYAAIVNHGEYRMPYIVQSTEQNGVEERVSPSLPTVAFSSNTAAALKEYLTFVLTDGTGSAAYSEGVSAGGKTGTAQTGWMRDGRKILNGWFCGFYEGEEDYVIVIVKEDVRSGSADCAPIFKTVTERMQKNGF